MSCTFSFVWLSDCCGIHTILSSVLTYTELYLFPWWPQNFQLTSLHAAFSRNCSACYRNLPFLGAVKVASGSLCSEQCCVGVRPFLCWSFLPVFRVLTDVGKRWDSGSEANAGAGLLSSLQGSPCPLLPSVLRSTAFSAVLQCSLLFLHCSSATCFLWASPCCLERLAFRRLRGAVAELFPACGTGKLWGAASSSRQGGPESSALSHSWLWGQGCCSFYEVLLHLLYSFLKISLWTAFKKHISTIQKNKIMD